MQLIIFIACQESLRINELGVRSEWMNELDLHKPVSMGLLPNWAIIKAVKFTSATFPFITIQVAYVHPSDLPIPPQSEWDSYQEVGEAMSVDIPDLGAESQLVTFNVSGQPPIMGSRLMRYVKTNHATRLHAIPTDWVRERFERFLPASESPYKAIYLTWVVERSLVTA